MRKVIPTLMFCLICSSVAIADDDDWDDYNYRNYRQEYPVYSQPIAPGYYREEIVYVPERVMEYVQPPVRYYTPPPPRYYAPAPSYRYDQRSPQGLVGTVVGGVIGYEMGAGDPLMTGIGAGAWIGN